MKYLGEHKNRKVYWWNFSQEDYDSLPDKNWICFAIADQSPDNEAFERFARRAFSKGITDFNAYGDFSEQLHDLFDEIEQIETDHKPEDVVMTAWDNEGFASAFWNCFYVSAMSDESNNIKIVCTHVNNIDKKDQIENFIERFNEEDWIPEEGE